MDVFDNQYDIKVGLSDFTQIFNATGDRRRQLLSGLKLELLEKQANRRKNERKVIEDRLQALNNDKQRLSADLQAKTLKLEEFQKADDFFKNYQRVTLTNVFSAAPNQQIGTAMCQDLHKAIQRALETGNMEQLNKDISSIKEQHNPQSFFSKILNRNKNKNLDKALDLAVSFVEAQKDTINNNPTLKQRFCNNIEEFNQQKNKLSKDIEQLNNDLLTTDRRIQEKNNDLQQFDKIAEKNVDDFLDNFQDLPEISLSADKIEDIVIEDEANIKDVASFNMTFIQKGCPGQDCYKDNATANRAAKLIAAAGFAITDNPEEAKNTGAFYLKGNEIFTPFIAKKDLPKYKALLAMLKENGAEPSNFNIPTQPEQILREKPDIQNIDISAFVSEAAQLGEHKRPDGQATECAINKKYNQKDFLYRGTMSADATYVGSARGGRQGIIYATDKVVNAAAYSGSKSMYIAGASGTGDTYVDNKVTYMKDGKQTTGFIGFIHVYENHNNKMYHNWEVENKTCNIHEANYETFLKTENRHVATYLTISDESGCQVDTVFEIPLNDPHWQSFLKAKGIDPKMTYQGGREELFERMKTQLAEVKKQGAVNSLSFSSVKTNVSEEEWKKIADKAEEKNKFIQSQTQSRTQTLAYGQTPPPPPVQSQAQVNSQTPPPPTPEMMSAQAQVNSQTPPPPTPEMMSAQAQVNSQTPPPPTSEIMRAQIQNLRLGHNICLERKQSEKQDTKPMAQKQNKEQVGKSNMLGMQRSGGRN